MRLLTQIRKLEAARSEAAMAAAAEQRMLFVTWFVYPPGYQRRLECGPGQEIATDVYVTGEPQFGPNYCMLEGELRDRVTDDAEDFGVIYDARGLKANVDPTTLRLPVLGRRADELGGVTVRRLAQEEARGQVNPFGVESWPGILRVKRIRPEKARGAKR